MTTHLTQPAPMPPDGRGRMRREMQAIVAREGLSFGPTGHSR